MGQFSYFNSDAFWDKLVVEHSNDVPKLDSKDTSLVIVTNRMLDTGKRFCTVQRSGVVRYYFVYSANAQWHLIPCNSLKRAVMLMPNKEKDWVVYTEGMGKFFTTDLDRGMHLAAAYGVNVLMMDYPTLRNDKNRIGNYFFAMKNAKIADRDFAPVFDTVERLRNMGLMGKGSMNLFFHSMGNIVMKNIVKDGFIGGMNDKPWVDNLILNAPCVLQKNHSQWMIQIRCAKHIYVHYNPLDFTLGGAYLMTKRYQLGKQVRKPISKNATYINFSGLVGKEHNYFISLYGRTEVTPQAYTHFNQLFHGKQVNVLDTNLYKPSTHRHIGYDILP